MNTPADIVAPEFHSYLASCKALYAKAWPGTPSAQDTAWSFTVGPKYIKVIHNGSAHSFISRGQGDVFKPASFKAPAKHARGNIFDAHNGLRFMGPYGPAYLR